VMDGGANPVAGGRTCRSTTSNPEATWATTANRISLRSARTVTDRYTPNALAIRWTARTQTQIAGKDARGPEPNVPRPDDSADTTEE
jgi:hypothetical protein